jgi:hypothetical protein
VVQTWADQTVLMVLQGTMDVLQVRQIYTYIFPAPGGHSLPASQAIHGQAITMVQACGTNMRDMRRFINNVFRACAGIMAQGLRRVLV